MKRLIIYYSYSNNTRKIVEILGENKVTGIRFEDGQILSIDGIFIAQGIAGGSDFAKKLRSNCKWR